MSSVQLSHNDRKFGKRPDREVYIPPAFRNNSRTGGAKAQAGLVAKKAARISKICLKIFKSRYYVVYRIYF